MTTRIYTDFEDFRATNPQLEGQWLLNGGTNWGWRTDTVGAGDSFIMRCYSNTGLIIEGISTSEGYGFYVPFKSGVWRNLGTGFDEDEVVILEPGSEHCETSEVDDGWHLFFVPNHVIGAPPHEPRRQSYTIKDPSARVIRTRIASILAAVAANSEIEGSPAMRVVEAELLSLARPLLTAEPGGAATAVEFKGPQLTASEVVHRAQAVMEASADSDPLTPSILAARIGVSERRLRDSFNERYQVGPRRYLLVRQLHAVRRELLSSEPDETTVTDTLTSKGVWQFGRFAKRYRDLFGELPSATLRRSLASSSSSYVARPGRAGEPAPPSSTAAITRAAAASTRPHRPTLQRQ